MNWPLLGNSLLVSASASLLAVMFGFLAGLFLLSLGAAWRNRMISVAILALALPPFVVTNCWLHYLGVAGVWRSWLSFNIMSFGGAIWVLSLMLWPVALLLIWSAWTRLQPSQFENDPTLTGLNLLRFLLIPLGRPALAQAAILTFVLALNNFAVPAILQVKVLPAEIWVRFSTTFDASGALRLSWPLVIVPLVLIFWLVRQEIRLPRGEGSVSHLLFRQQLGVGWFGVSACCSIALCLLAIGLPVFDLLTVKRVWTELPGAVAAGKGAIWHSIFFGAVSAAFIVGISLVASMISRRWFGRAVQGNWWRRRKRHGGETVETVSNVLATGDTPLKRGVNEMGRLSHAAVTGYRLSLMRLLLWLPFLVPGVLLGICLVKLLNRPWFSFFYESQAIIILAFVVRYIAMGWTALIGATEAVDLALTDSSLVEGANRWQMLRYVVWPQIASQLGAVWYLVFLLCLWDVETMILVYPPGAETLALRIFNLLHYGYNPQISALCLTLMALAAVPLALWKAAVKMKARST